MVYPVSGCDMDKEPGEEVEKLLGSLEVKKISRGGVLNAAREVKKN